MERFLGNSPQPRLSIGFGVNWNSPFGPLRIDLAKALLNQQGRRHQTRHFQRRDPILMKTKLISLGLAAIALAARWPSRRRRRPQAVGDRRSRGARCSRRKAFNAANTPIQTTYECADRRSARQQAHRSRAADARARRSTPTRTARSRQAPDARAAGRASCAIQIAAQAARRPSCRAHQRAVDRAQAYAIEQISQKLNAAVQTRDQRARRQPDRAGADARWCSPIRRRHDQRRSPPSSTALVPTVSIDAARQLAARPDRSAGAPAGSRRPRRAPGPGAGAAARRSRRPVSDDDAAATSPSARSISGG